MSSLFPAHLQEHGTGYNPAVKGTEPFCRASSLLHQVPDLRTALYAPTNLDLLSKRLLECNGLHASLGETEYNGRQHDLFGFADLIAFLPLSSAPSGMQPSLRTISGTPCRYGSPILIQVTTQAQILARMQKIQSSPIAQSWLSEIGPIWVFGYLSPASRPDRLNGTSIVDAGITLWEPLQIRRVPHGQPIPVAYSLLSFEG